MKSSLITASLLILIFIACTNTVGSIEEEEVEIEVKQPELIIKNGFNQDVYYAVFDEDVAALVDWAPVATEENRIRTNSSVSILTTEIEMYEVGDKIHVFYWTKDNALFESEIVQ